jgi:hypothetical protein
VAEEVRKYAVAGLTKVYVIGTGLAVDRAGFRIVLQGQLNYWRSKITTTVTQRSPNNALRLAGIMCDPEERENIQKIMANKKGARAQSDQADYTFTAYFQSIVAKFKSSTYVVERQSNVKKIKGNESFDANDVSENEFNFQLVCFSHSIQIDRYSLDGRDGKWLQQLWEVYLRPKYRDSLKRWFSETGGGSGNIWDFQGYCGNERWLAWVYMLDANSGFLLCSNASPICPDSLCNESGFFKVGSEKSAGTPSFRNKKDKLKDQLDKAESSSEMIQKAVGALTEFIEYKNKL